MTTFTLTINCNGAMFDGGEELSAIFGHMSRLLNGHSAADIMDAAARNGHSFPPIRDSNGNLGGEWRITAD